MPPKRKKTKTAAAVKKSVVTKRLQTELQSLIAYASYDSKAVLQGGVSASKAMLIVRLYEAYMPSPLADDDRISFLEMFLGGMNKFKCLFIQSEESDAENSRDPDNDRPSMKLIIPESLHCIAGAEIVVAPHCITKSLLTRKNLTNLADIKANTLFRNAKAVEANCKKALAICVGKDSPYRDFDGTFPSGTNWEDYLLWIRKKMFLLDKVIKDNLVDVDDDAESNDGDSNETDSVGKYDNANSDEDALPSDVYFKGFFSFALWGYIPPPGGGDFKSSLMSVVVDKKVNRDKKDGRASILKEKMEDSVHTQELEARGTPKAIEAEDVRFQTITDIMVKGRQEMQKQKLFKLSVNRIEFELRYAGERIGEIKEEIKELKELLEDGDNDENVDTELEITELQKELRKTRQRKKKLFLSWKITTTSEESRRTLLNNEADGNDNTSMSVSTSNESTSMSVCKSNENIPLVFSPITISDDCVTVHTTTSTSEITEDATNSSDVMND